MTNDELYLLKDRAYYGRLSALMYRTEFIKVIDSHLSDMKERAKEMEEIKEELIETGSKLGWKRYRLKTAEVLLDFFVSPEVISYEEFLNRLGIYKGARELLISYKNLILYEYYEHIIDLN